MARMRTIKPEFWTSSQIVECSITARLLFIGLWNFCDDAGIHPANPKRIKMEIFPADDIDSESILRMLDELSENDLIIMYTNDNKDYLQVTGWKAHQRIDKPTYKFPRPFDDHSQSIRRPLSERSDTDRNRSGIGMDRSGEDRRGIGEEKEKKTPLSNPRFDQAEITAIFDHWRKVMNHPSAKLDDKRKKIIGQVIKTGYTVDQCQQAIDGCAKTPHNMGDNDRGQVYDGMHIIFKPENIDRFIAASHRPPMALVDQDPFAGFVAAGGGVGDSDDATTIEGECSHG